MNRVILMRHAEAENDTRKMYVGTMPGISLTAAGRYEAAAMADHLAGMAIDGIYSSGLERAYDTACIVASRLSRAVVVEKRLDQRRMGDLAGKKHEEMERKYGEWGLAYWRGDGMMTALGVESPQDIMDRMESLVWEVRRRHGSHNVLLVGHTDPMRAAAIRIGGIDPGRGYGLRIRNASLLVLDYQNAGSPGVSIIWNSDVGTLVRRVLAPA